MSPDLNPIESIWGWMTQQVYRHEKQYTSIAELTAAIREAWASIPQWLLTNLSKRMHDRCCDVDDLLGKRITNKRKYFWG